MTDAHYRKEKKLLRDHARSLRASLSKAEIEEKSGLICRHVLKILDGTDTLMVYVSKPLEVNTKDLIGHLLSRRKTVIVPIIEKETKTLRLSYLKDPVVLTGKYISCPRTCRP